MLASTLLMFALFSAPLAAQSLADYTEFYRQMRINALERFEFCYPAADPAHEPLILGVRHDSLGRATQITRFRFGNPDNRSDWATMRIAYRAYDSLDIVVERRNYYNAGGIPVNVDWAFSEEVYFRKNGMIVQRKIVDRNGKPVDDSSGVHRAMFRSEIPGTFVEDWYISTGKSHYGTGSDAAPRDFAPMPPATYYRRFSVDEKGRLIREEVWGFLRKPIPFPGGEMVHAYELNECGQQVKVIFRTLDDKPMDDSRGVAAIARAYDTAGRLVEERTLDADGRLKEVAPDGAAITRYNFRAFDGLLLGVERLDEDEKPVK